MPLQYPYFPTPGLEQTDEMKRQALAQALMQFGQQMVQPAQGKNQLHQLLTAIPGSVNAGMQGYQKSLLGEMGKQQEATQTDLYKTHADINRMSMEEKQSEMQQKKIENEWLKNLPDAIVSTEGTMPGIDYRENKLAEHAAINSPIPASVYRKNPRILLKWLEGNIEKTKGLMVTFPGIEQPVPLDEALKLKQLYKAETEKEPTSDFKLFYQTHKQAGKPDEWISNEWLRRQERLKQISPPIYNVIQTGEGYAGVNLRNPKQSAVTIKTDEGKILTKPIPPEIQGKISELLTIKDALNEIGRLYKDKYVGPVKGRVGKVEEEWVGNLPSEQVEFYNWTRDIKDALLRARSGAQINEQEYKRLTSFLPGENLPPATFKARKNRFEQEVNIIISNKSKMLEEGGYKVPTGIQTQKPKGNITKSGNRFTIEEIP